jgi:hypothetical protein
VILYPYLAAAGKSSLFGNLQDLFGLCRLAGGAPGARQADAAPLGDLAVADHERGLRGLPGAVSAEAGPGALGEAEGRGREVARCLGADQLGAAGEGLVEVAGIVEAADVDQDPVSATLGIAK